MIPTFTLDPVAPELPAPLLQDASTALRQHGCVLFHGLFSAAFVAQLRAAHRERHAEFLRAAAPAGAGEVGNRRYMTALEISGPFANPDFYANAKVLPVLRAVLGNSLVLGACGAVTSLPGATAQHVHRDGSPLFNKAVNRITPAHAIDFFVPLVDFNDETGTTRVFPGSHLNADADPATAPYVDPVIPAGSAMLMDYRLLHQGRGNLSELIRPLLFAVYHHPWFKDYRNHPSQPFLRISDAEYARIAPEHRGLLSWTEHYRNGLY